MADKIDIRSLVQVVGMAADNILLGGTIGNVLDSLKQAQLQIQKFTADSPDLDEAVPFQEFIGVYQRRGKPTWLDSLEKGRRSVRKRKARKTKTSKQEE